MGTISVNVATPEEFVTAVRVLGVVLLTDIPPIGPLCSMMVTVSPATGLPSAASTVTAAEVGDPALVLDGSVEKKILLARPPVEIGTDDPHVQLVSSMPEPHQTEHRS